MKDIASVNAIWKELKKMKTVPKMRKTPSPPKINQQKRLRMIANFISHGYRQSNIHFTKSGRPYVTG
jgi:hypothetical protein